MDKLLTTKQLADYLKLTETTIYRYVKEGKVPAQRENGRWKFNRDTIDEMMEGGEKVPEV